MVAALIIDVSGLELPPLLLHHAADSRKVVISRLHRPDLIAFGTEGLGGVGLDSTSMIRGSPSAKTMKLPTSL